ncbi:HAMP domain-containing methyl-accepting chemotaxis protein [Lichenifustis flavocetrariae]|uniref:Methyl-accepting chemotaxis protein n=1 Tax=Lichenifustis flavocetrariae TaxID=2949735 RepID=A0AA42CI97_9HYPH|nr:methyl-accepting chemotaxis protein [Lichenifustis flavocetrariae]MCW6506616.1 methyl-accepting chemotaxis protein [Lichenifustis flavocetrariae]
MKNISILGKFLSVITLFALFCVGATLFSTSKMRVIDDTYSDLSDHQGAAGISMARANRALWAMRSSMADLLIARKDDEDRAAQATLSANRAEFINLMDQSAVLLPEHATRFAALKQNVIQALEKACAETVELGKATDTEGVLKAQSVYSKDCAPALMAMAADLRATVDDLLKETKVINDATSDVTNATIYTTWALIMSGMVLLALTGFFVVRTWISKPLTTLAGSMSAIAGGDYKVEILDADRKDEIGTIARVAQVFKTTGLEKIALEAQAARQRQEAEEARVRDEQARKSVAEQQAQVVDSLASGLENLARGNLMFRIDHTFAPEYEKLRADFNGAIGQLQDTISVISASTSAIRSGTAEISTASDDLSRRTEQQAASLEETAAALDEITATVKKTSEGSRHAQKVVGSAKSDAEHSGLVVSQAVEAMSAIEQSAHQISQIIGVIDEIAFQTNLLALNAGVEAARAGEAGRGFAVVASEVRALAQRSAEAAKEIKALISTSSQQVGAGVDLVNETGDALKRIVTQVAEINEVVSNIATSTQEQATALQEVNTAINQMDQVTQQNAAMVEESTAASKNLATETQELARLIGQFQVDASHRPTTARPQAKPARKTVTALKTTGSGGAARKPEAAAQSWEEF